MRTATQLSWLLAVGAFCASGVADAQSVYRYRDAKGNWVYADRKPDGAVVTEQIKIKKESLPPRISIEPVVNNKQVKLRAINECSCSVEFGLRVVDSEHLVISETNDAAVTNERGLVRAVLPPRAEKTLLELIPDGLGVPTYQLQWEFQIGAPGSRHQPVEPYRVPYAIGQSFRVTQAYPASITHTTAASRYAVDIALPEQTPVYAARAGRVINVAHENFRGGTSRAMMEEANFVLIQHDDDSVAMYAHLHWDSIRVSPGQWVQRGEYIADSGSTGFSSGPHLHFSITRNAGLKEESVPVVFAGSNGEPVTPISGMMLKAY